MNLADLVRSQQPKRDKLSSQQDFGILDELLIRALVPLEAETQAYFEWLGEVVAFCVSSRRRQNEPLMEACVRGLCGEPGSARAVVEAGIDRELVLGFLGRVGDAGASLERAQLEHVRRRANRVDSDNLVVMAEAKRLLGDGPLVAPATRTSRYWFELALVHKKSIIDHYLRLLMKGATRISRASGGRIEADPAFQDSYVAADTAANRFRPDQGVFATYLSGYLKGSGRVSASNGLGLAAPGARVLSADALQADTIDGIEIVDAAATHGLGDDHVIRAVDAIAGDADVRAALMVSDVLPPAALALRSTRVNQVSKIS